MRTSVTLRTLGGGVASHSVTSRSLPDIVVYVTRLFLCLQGCLPLVLMFDMKEETDIDQGKSAYVTCQSAAADLYILVIVYTHVHVLHIHVHVHISSLVCLHR